MMLADIPIPALLAIGASTLVGVGVVVLVWRREDPVWLKVAVTGVAFIPVVGPLFTLWVTSFPDRMHPALRAKHPKVVNTYTLPFPEALPKRRPKWHAVWRRRPHPDAPGKRRGDVI